MMKKTISYIFAACIAATMLVSQAWSNTGTLEVEANPDAGAVNPINVQALTGESEGNKFLSFTANILDTVQDKISGTVNDVTAPYEEWSYSRGIGLIPDSCPAGIALTLVYVRKTAQQASIQLLVFAGSSVLKVTLMVEHFVHYGSGGLKPSLKNLGFSLAS